MSESTNTPQTPNDNPQPTPTAPTQPAPTLLDRTPVEVTVVRRPCLCGCGEFPTRESADFVPGHDAKLKSALVAAHLAGTTFLLKDGDNELEVTALELATERDWDPYLVVAARKAAKEAADKAAKAQKAS